MTQIFSSYPDGIAGFALILLRGSAVALLIAVLLSPGVPMYGLQVAVVLIAAALVLGFGTRVAVVLGAIIAVLTLPIPHKVPIMLVISQGLSLCGLLLLGPGAFSVDARLFGRRKLSLRKDSARHDR